jgi:hypothetical protein
VQPQNTFDKRDVVWVISVAPETARRLDRSSSQIARSASIVAVASRLGGSVPTHFRYTPCIVMSSSTGDSSDGWDTGTIGVLFRKAVCGAGADGRTLWALGRSISIGYSSCGLPLAAAGRWMLRGGGTRTGSLGLPARMCWVAGFPGRIPFAQARSVIAVAQNRCAQPFDPPGCATLWRPCSGPPLALLTSGPSQRASIPVLALETQPPTGLPSRPTCRGAGPLQVLKTRRFSGNSRHAGPVVFQHRRRTPV